MGRHVYSGSSSVGINISTALYCHHFMSHEELCSRTRQLEWMLSWLVSANGRLLTNANGKPVKRYRAIKFLWIRNDILCQRDFAVAVDVLADDGLAFVSWEANALGSICVIRYYLRFSPELLAGATLGRTLMTKWKVPNYFHTDIVFLKQRLNYANSFENLKNLKRHVFWEKTKNLQVQRGDVHVEE